MLKFLHAYITEATRALIIKQHPSAVCDTPKRFGGDYFKKKGAIGGSKSNWKS